MFKAEEDFVSADLLMHAGEAPIPDYVCFRCQQCAEKYLKAYLPEHMVEFERKHDLMPLLKLCNALDKEFQKTHRELNQLDRYAFVVRYLIVKDWNLLYVQKLDNENDLSHSEIGLD